MIRFVTALFLFLTIPTILAEPKTAAEIYFDQYVDSGTLISPEEAAEQLKQKQAAEAAQLAAEEAALAEEERLEANKLKLSDIEKSLPQLEGFGLDKLIDKIASNSENVENAEDSESARAAKELELKILEQIKKKPLIFVGFGLLFISFITWAISHIILIVRGFEEAVGWGLAVLFIPLAGFIYCCMRLKKMKAVILVFSLAVIFLITGFVLIYISIDPELKESLQELEAINFGTTAKLLESTNIVNC